MRLLASLALLLAAGPALALNPTRVDRYGDPLPAGAVARLGTTYLSARQGTRTYRFGADGKTFRAEAAGPAVAEYDAATGRLVRRVQLPGLEGSWPWLSADGSLAVCEQPGGVHRLVEVATGKTRFDLPAWARIQEQQEPFTPDGRRLAAFDRQSPPRVHVWDTATGESRVVGSPSTQPTRLQFTPDGSKLVSWGYGGVGGWDVAAGRRLWQSADIHLPPVVSPDGRLVGWQAAAGSMVVDIATGRPPPGHKPIPPGVNYPAAFSPDGTAVVVSKHHDPDRGWGLWDLAAGAWRVRWDRVYVDRGVFDPAGKTVLRAAGYNRFQRWELATGQPLYPDVGDRGHPQWAADAAFDPSGKRVVTLAPDDTLREWDPADGRLVRTVRQVPGDMSNGAARVVGWLDPDRVVVDGMPYGSGRLMYATVDLAAGKLASWVEHPGSGHSDSHDREGRARLLPGGVVRRVFSTNVYTDRGYVGGDQAQDWDLAAEKPVRVRPIELRPDGRPHPAVLSADGRVASDGMVVADVETGKPLFALTRDDHQGRQEAAFSADGRFVAVRTVRVIQVPDDGIRFGLGDRGGPRTRDEPAGVWVWDVPTRAPVARVPVGADRVALTPDGRFLLTLDATGVSAWDLVTARQVVHHKVDPRRGYHEGAGETRTIVPAPDGRTAVTVRLDGTCLVWDFAAAYRQATTPPPTDADLAAVWAAWSKPDINPLAGLWRLADHPGRSVPFLRDKVKELVKPTPAPTADDIRVAIAELDAPDFKTREAAERRLLRSGGVARPAVAEALPKASPEARARLGRVLGRLDADPVPPLWAEDVPLAWAVAVLERVNTPDARTVVEQIAAGPPASRLTREAKAALDRMRR